MNLENNKTLLVGLWNPQSKYLKTRHNIGADILEKFCIKNSIEVKLDKSGSFKIGQESFENSDVDIIFPMVSMNNSGEALKAYLKYNNVEASNILVIHDDIDLGFGRLRLKSGSSDGGHNGIKSINSYLQSNEYFRLKVGVGRPPKEVNPADFVLSRFYNNEEEEVEFLMEDSVDIIEMFIKDKEIDYVDLRFTDPRGKLQHVTMDTKVVDEDMLNDGIFFDGSSIAGWKAINESDMILKPDLSRTVVDPFTSHNTLNIFCDILDAIKKDPYERDPRGTAKKAEAYLKKSGIGDKAFFGPEAEFFVFDDVRFKNDMNETGFKIDSTEGPYNTGKKYENGNMGHRPGIKGGYFPVPPVDSAQDMRSEYLKAMKDMGIKVEKHHHEVAPSQHELGMYFGTLVDQADNLQLYKYAVHMVSHSFGKTATFMPKPVKGDNGSGMHVHQSIWKGNTALFSGDKYAGLSDLALHYIGGILKHAKAINAFSNATTNSYKRLIPGFEAPVLLAYSARNRSASCRIPITLSKKAAICEIRFGDAAGNPYLTFAAMLMAGLDGIKNKIDPGKSFDKDLYALSENEVKKIPTVCGSLREAMESLDKDRDFLKQGNVFTDDQIDAYIALKFEEIHNFEHTPHPIEFDMYYSC